MYQILFVCQKEKTIVISKIKLNTDLIKQTNKQIFDHQSLASFRRKIIIISHEKFVSNRDFFFFFCSKLQKMRISNLFENLQSQKRNEYN